VEVIELDVAAPRPSADELSGQLEAAALAVGLPMTQQGTLRRDLQSSHWPCLRPEMTALWHSWLGPRRIGPGSRYSPTGERRGSQRRSQGCGRGQRRCWAGVRGVTPAGLDS